MAARIEVLHEKVDKLQESVDLLHIAMDNVQSQNVVLGDIENMVHIINNRLFNGLYEGKQNGSN
tara:strand:+ start:726 stop:917 length:192 start_codon:yes stop_codon:yes gene_type:complete